MYEENTNGFSNNTSLDFEALSEEEFLSEGIESQKNSSAEEKRNDESVKNEISVDDDGCVEIVGIRFRGMGKEYFFSPAGLSLEVGNKVITETARGMELGDVTRANEKVSISQTVAPLRPIMRLATEKDILHFEENLELEKEAMVKCNEQIEKHGLEMSLTGAEYTFDNKKLLFYFTSEGRVDFRELVKDLAYIFHTRIELRQIGIRDEAKMIGGLGICGRPFCCSTFLNDFGQVSIKMAKEQNLSLSSTNISGPCGRLMCCLRYEHATYEEEISKTPPVGTYVSTPEGNGTVTEINPLAGKVKVHLSKKYSEAPVEFYRDQVKKTEKRKKDEDAENEAMERKANKEAQAAEREAKRSRLPKPKLRPYVKPDFEETEIDEES